MSVNDDYKKENLREYFDSYVAEADRAVADLKHAVDFLPSVDNKGGSDCPVAESLYAQKEEKEDKVRRLLARFRTYISCIEHEMEKALSTLGRVQGAAASLHSDAPRRELSDGVKKAQYAYSRLVSQREKAALTVKQLNSVLSDADRKKWPLDKPGQSTPSWKGQGSSHPSGPNKKASVGVPPMPGLSDEINSLRSSGSGQAPIPSSFPGDGNPKLFSPKT